MKKSPMQRHTPLQAKTPMQRGTPMLRSRMKRKQRRVTAAERAVYVQATENARNADGVLICASCSKPIRDGEEARGHIKSRGAGGKTTVDNIQILHALTCHPRKHGERVTGVDAQSPVSDGALVAGPHPLSFGVATSERSHVWVGDDSTVHSLAGRNPETVFTGPAEGSDRE